jgi:hypothetical protein
MSEHRYRTKRAAGRAAPNHFRLASKLSAQSAGTMRTFDPSGELPAECDRDGPARAASALQSCNWRVLPQ